MLFTKLALVTCVLYLAISILLDATIFGLAIWKGSAGITLTHAGRYLLFGLIWLASFSVAWQLVVAPVLARIHK